jgi:hypothetical protein
VASNPFSQPKWILGRVSASWPGYTGEELGLDIEAGWSQRIGAVMGSFLTFAHLVTLSVLEISLGQSQKAERGLRSMNTAYASDLVENLGS